MGIRDWFKPKPPAEDPSKMLATARQVVSEFFDKAASGGLDIHDEKELPYEKGLILKSLQLVYAVETTSEVKEAVLVGASLLAHFQPDVGPAPLCAAGMPAEALNSLQEMDPEHAAEILAGHAEEKAKFDRLVPVVEEEGKRMMALVKGYSLAAARTIASR